MAVPAAPPRGFRRHRSTAGRPGVSGATDRPGSGPSVLGEAIMQSAQPRDLGALILVIGVFLVLFVVTLTMGSPVR
jgi:hypothetical protein